MKGFISLSILSLLVLFGCSKSSPLDQRMAIMDRFEQLADPATGMLNLEASAVFVEDARAFSDAYPSDTMAAMPLYRSAEISRSLGKAKETIDTYQKILERYPTFHKAAEAQFMLAFSYDEDLKDIEKARQAYTEFIQQHPNHTFADDAQMLLSNLGKSDEEILQELEARLKENAEAPQ